MRYPASEKLEIIRLVEESNLSARLTLAKLGIPRTTFYRWYNRYLQRGEAGLQDQRPKPKHVWNRVWGTGPAVTSARLSNTKELIQVAWLLRDSIAGVLIRKEGLSFLPIYLSSEALAYKLCGKADFWISFNEIKGELKS